MQSWVRSLADVRVKPFNQQINKIISISIVYHLYNHLSSQAVKLFMLMFVCRIYLVALTMSTNSGLRLAPPTRKPSMSGQLASSLALAAVTEPPYWMRTAPATSGDTLVDSQLRRDAWTSCAYKNNITIYLYAGFCKLRWVA